MVGELLSNVFSQVIVVLVTIWVVSSSPVKRSATEGLFSSPCFVLNNEDPALSKPLNESIEDLIERTAGLEHESNELKNMLKTKYSFNTRTVEYLETMNWMGEEEFLANDDQIDAAISQPIEALKAHFLLLAENRLYIEQARTTGSMTKESEADTREHLHDFEQMILSCMCSIEIAIRSSGNNVSDTITSEILSSAFLQNAKPLENATFRTYVTIQDSLQLVQFLNTIYKEMNDTEA